MQNIHPTAIIADQAKLAADVTVGPYAIIEDGVEIGARTVIGPHVVIHSNTRIGTDNQIHAHAVLGDLPQHQAYKPGTVSGVVIGDNNTIREMVTIHRALYQDQDTRIGSGNLFMVNSHIGHDCIIGNNIVLTNNSATAGHVEVDDNVIIGGLTGIHQFVRIGAYSMIAASVMVRKDILPYTMVGGDPVKHYRLNTVGLRRNGITGDCYRQLERMYRALRDGKEIEEGETKESQYLYQWLQQKSDRGLSGFLK